MVTLEQVYERVLARLASDNAHAVELVKAVIRDTIKEVGLVVSERTGEVYDPAPKPVINYPNNQVQNGVHYRGQRRRGYRR